MKCVHWNQLVLATWWELINFKGSNLIYIYYINLEPRSVRLNRTPIYSIPKPNRVVIGFDGSVNRSMTVLSVFDFGQFGSDRFVS